MLLCADTKSETHCSIVHCLAWASLRGALFTHACSWHWFVDQLPSPLAILVYMGHFVEFVLASAIASCYEEVSSIFEWNHAMTAIVHGKSCKAVERWYVFGLFCPIRISVNRLRHFKGFWSKWMCGYASMCFWGHLSKWKLGGDVWSMGHYQEDGIGVKGFTSDEGVARGVEGDSWGVLPRSWGNPETHDRLW